MIRRWRRSGWRAVFRGAVFLLLLSLLSPACSSSKPDDPIVALSVTFSPNPVTYSDAGTWTYLVSVTEIKGRGVYISDFVVERFSPANVKYSTAKYTANKFQLWFDNCGGSGTYIAGGTTRCTFITSLEGINSGHADWTFNGVDTLGKAVTGKGRIDWL